MGLSPAAAPRQEQLFLNAALALEGKRGPERSQDQPRVEKLEQKIRLKDEVLAELMAEQVLAVDHLPQKFGVGVNGRKGFEIVIGSGRQVSLQPLLLIEPNQSHQFNRG